MVLSVLESPVPASTGTRLAASSTASCSKASYSTSYSAGASPVDPATTSARVPASICCLTRRRQASMSTSPAAVKGVVSAVMLPESRRGLATARCYLRRSRTGKYAGHTRFPLQRTLRLDRSRPCQPSVAQREPPADQRLHDASAVPAAGGDPAHRRQRLQPGGHPAGDRGTGRLGHRARHRFLGRGRQARDHARQARARRRPEAGLVPDRAEAGAVEPAALRGRGGGRRQARHPVPARRLLRPPGHHHRVAALLALPRHADRRREGHRAGHHRHSGGHAHRRVARRLPRVLRAPERRRDHGPDEVLTMAVTGEALSKTALGLPLALDDGSSATLADFAGQWLVLYFYPKDSTPGCTTEGKDF